MILAGTASFASAANLEDAFRTPPNSARPGVYWYFMDGNLDGVEMVKDLESMKEACNCDKYWYDHPILNQYKRLLAEIAGKPLKGKDEYVLT